MFNIKNRVLQHQLTIMNPRIAPLHLLQPQVDSMREKRGDLSPRSIFREIAEPPAKAPFRVMFEIFGDAGEAEETRSEKMRERDRMSRILCNFHFADRSFWVYPSGAIVRRNALLDLLDRVAPREEVVLRIDFRYEMTNACALSLPLDARVKDVMSPYTGEVWRLCLSRESDNDFHDRIMFCNGAFVLQSVAVKYDKEKYPQK